MSEIPSHLTGPPNIPEQDRAYASGPFDTLEAVNAPKKLFKSPFPPENATQPGQFPLNDSAARSNSPFERGDSLKHVAIWSQASIQRDVAAAKHVSRPRIPAQSANMPLQTRDPFASSALQPGVMPSALNRNVLNVLPVVQPQMPPLQWGQQAQPVAQIPQMMPPTMPPQQNNHDVGVLSKKDRKAARRAKRQAKLLLTVSARPFKHSWLEVFMLVLLLAGYLFTILLNVSSLMNDYTIYHYARDGVQQLLAVKNQATAMKAHITNLDPNVLAQMQGELAAARDDFLHLHDKLKENVYFDSIGTSFPQYTNTLLALCQIGSDASDIGQVVVKLAGVYAPALHGSLLADTTTAKPIVTPDILAQTKTTLDYMLPRLRDIQAQLPSVSLDSLPLSVAQRDQIDQILQYVPIVVTDATQLDDLMGAVGWILGVGQPRTFLVQTLDRAELRPTGGFTGQFGELSLNGARMSPFKLQNIGPFEDPISGNTPSIVQGNLAPSAYRSWWPIANWGLRDSNLSADFPTSAKIAIAQYKAEFKHQTDGLMVFSPFLVARVIAATGPIYIPEYGETVTSQNLESLLHYYQLDNTGIRKEEIVEHVYDSTQARKLFTARVLADLENTVRHAPISELIGIAHEMLHALKTRDLQVYVTNSQIEGLLMQYGAAATIDRSTTHDGLFVVQANVNANKASQYVQTILHDTVTLDAKGGATHVLQMRLVYHQVGQVYGPDTYHDYVRIYVPPSSQYLWGNGFEQLGQPLCAATAGFAACPTYDPYGNGDLMCPAGLSDPYVETAQVNDPYADQYHPLNKEGPPTNMTSDEPQRAMYAGWVLVPKNCTMTVSLSWYVPPMGSSPYSLLVQRQSGTYPLVDVTILPVPGACGTLHTTGKHFDTVLDRDATFSIQGNNAEQGGGSSCYVQPGV